MSSVQVPFAGEAMAITAAPSWIRIVRRVTGVAIGIQRPVGDPHLRVGRIGINHPAGGAVAIRPIASIVEIVHGIPRAAAHDMAGRNAATALVALPQRVYAPGVTGHAIAASGRDTRLQVRNGGVTEVAVATMGDIDRFIR